MNQSVNYLLLLQNDFKNIFHEKEFFTRQKVDSITTNIKKKYHGKNHFQIEEFQTNIKTAFYQISEPWAYIQLYLAKYQFMNPMNSMITLLNMQTKILMEFTLDRLIRRIQSLAGECKKLIQGEPKGGLSHVCNQCQKHIQKQNIIKKFDDPFDLYQLSTTPFMVKAKTAKNDFSEEFLQKISDTLFDNDCLDLDFNRYRVDKKILDLENGLDKKQKCLNEVIQQLKLFQEGMGHYQSSRNNAHQDVLSHQKQTMNGVSNHITTVIHQLYLKIKNLIQLNRPKTCEIASQTYNNDKNVIKQLQQQLKSTRKALKQSTIEKQKLVQRMNSEANQKMDQIRVILATKMHIQQIKDQIITQKQTLLNQNCKLKKKVDQLSTQLGKSNFLLKSTKRNIISVKHLVEKASQTVLQDQGQPERNFRSRGNIKKADKFYMQSSIGNESDHIDETNENSNEINENSNYQQNRLHPHYILRKQRYHTTGNKSHHTVYFRNSDNNSHYLSKKVIELFKSDENQSDEDLKKEKRGGDNNESISEAIIQQYKSKMQEESVSVEIQVNSSDFECKQEQSYGSLTVKIGKGQLSNQTTTYPSIHQQKTKKKRSKNRSQILRELYDNHLEERSRKSSVKDKDQMVNFDEFKKSIDFVIDRLVNRKKGDPKTQKFIARNSSQQRKSSWKNDLSPKQSRINRSSFRKLATQISHHSTKPLNQKYILSKISQKSRIYQNVISQSPHTEQDLLSLTAPNTFKSLVKLPPTAKAMKTTNHPLLNLTEQSQITLQLFMNMKNVQEYEEMQRVKRVNKLKSPVIFLYATEIKFITFIMSQFARLHLLQTQFYKVLKEIIIFPKNSFNHNIIDKNDLSFEIGSINNSNAQLKDGMNYLLMLHRKCGEKKQMEQICKHFDNFVKKLVEIGDYQEKHRQKISNSLNMTMI